MAQAGHFFSSLSSLWPSSCASAVQANGRMVVDAFNQELPLEDGGVKFLTHAGSMVWAWGYRKIKPDHETA